MNNTGELSIREQMNAMQRDLHDMRNSMQIHTGDIIRLEANMENHSRSIDRLMLAVATFPAVVERLDTVKNVVYGMVGVVLTAFIALSVGAVMSVNVLKSQLEAIVKDGTQYNKRN